MKQSPGCDSMSGKVVRINKSLYGLKEISRQFNKLLVSDFVKIGFEQSVSDPCVMRSMMDGELTGIVVIHLDDVIFAGASDTDRRVAETLNEKLLPKHRGELIWCHG